MKFTIMRHMIDQMVSPQIPETSGDCRMILSMILMFTRINRLSNPDRPGNECGGIIKLNQLITTVMLVGRYDCIMCLKRYLDLRRLSLLALMNYDY